jgi:hypothetical protein
VIKSLYYDTLDKVLNYYGRGWMLNISLPDRIIDFIERQAIADGFDPPSEYVSHIILQTAKDWTLRIDGREVRSPTSRRSRGSAVILESPVSKRF